MDLLEIRRGYYEKLINPENTADSTNVTVLPIFSNKHIYDNFDSQNVNQVRMKDRKGNLWMSEKKWELKANVKGS